MRLLLHGWVAFSRRAGWVHPASLRWVGPLPDRFFVMPRQQSMLAVEVDLLEFLSAHFLHMPASFAAVFRVWSDLHPHQRELLLGLQGPWSATTHSDWRTLGLPGGWLSCCPRAMTRTSLGTFPPLRPLTAHCALTPPSYLAGRRQTDVRAVISSEGDLLHAFNDLLVRNGHGC